MASRFYSVWKRTKSWKADVTTWFGCLEKHLSVLIMLVPL